MKVRGLTMLMEEMDAIGWVMTTRNIKENELIDLEENTLSDSFITLVNSLTKLLSLTSLTPCAQKFDFACTLIEDSQKRTVRNGFTSDDSRVHWMKYLCEKQK